MWALAETDPQSCHSALVDYDPATVVFQFFLELAKLISSSVSCSSYCLASFDPSDLCSLLLQKSLPRFPSLKTVLPILAPFPKIFLGLRLIFIITVVTERRGSFIYLFTSIFSFPTWIVNSMRQGDFSVLFTIRFPASRRKCLVHLRSPVVRGWMNKIHLLLF